MWRVLQRLTFLDFSRNHFELLGLPLAYAIDPSRLEAGYRKLQSHVHPDRFAAGSEAERRVAMQWAARANEAYRTLRDPVGRARYLLSLKGFETVAAAAGARDTARLEELREELREERSAMLRMLERAIDADSNYDAGCSLVRKLRFIDKLDEEIDEALA